MANLRNAIFYHTLLCLTAGAIAATGNITAKGYHLVIGSDQLSVTSRKPPESNFGFNYWPYKGSHHNLIDSKWTPVMKEEVKKDIDVMASFGCRVLRLMFWPHYCGYMIDPNEGGGTFTAEYDQIRNNLIEMLGFCAERDIKVIIASGNCYILENPPLWQSAYGEDFDAFLQDCSTWFNGIIQSIENSKYASTVIYYDLHNEISDVRIKMWPYIRFLYDNCSIPKGKYGISILRTAKDTTILKKELGDRRMDYVEFHSYPDLTYANNRDLQAAYKIVTENFPDSTIVLGEYGGMGLDPCNLYPTTIEPSSEHTQQATEADLIKWVRDVQLPYYLHWMLWDRTPENAENQIAGWGYKHHQPKDVMGKMADILGIIPNADMEDVSGIQPANWTADGTVSVKLIHHSDSATNLLCARLTVDQPSGLVWMESESVAVEGGRKLFLNCYVRASMNNIYMSVKEYDSIKNLIKTNIGPGFTPSKWRWYNYLHATKSWAVILSPKTEYITITVNGEIRDSSSILDVDTVSAWADKSFSITSNSKDTGTVYVKIPVSFSEN